MESSSPENSHRSNEKRKLLPPTRPSPMITVEEEEEGDRKPAWKLPRTDACRREHIYFDEIHLRDGARTEAEELPVTGVSVLVFRGYPDYSGQIDPDPNTPLTPPGRVPNFYAKLHCVLSHEEGDQFRNIVAWESHGRSWRIGNRDAFEQRILGGAYFDEPTVEAFLATAVHKWGFRAVVHHDQSSSALDEYYHPRFLRGLLHLCKGMTAYESFMASPTECLEASSYVDNERKKSSTPDLPTILEQCPGKVPVRYTPDKYMVQLRQCLERFGPHARMPIYSGEWLHDTKPKATVKNDGPTSFDSSSASSSTSSSSASLLCDPEDGKVKSNGSTVTPGDHEALLSFQSALESSEKRLNQKMDVPPPLPTSAAAAAMLPSSACIVNSTNLLLLPAHEDRKIPPPAATTASSRITALSIANKMAFVSANIQPFHRAFPVAPPHQLWSSTTSP
jgi:HSF-type DNA-binding